MSEPEKTHDDPHRAALQRHREMGFLIGLAAAFTGMAAIDWRVALIVAGVAVAGMSFYGMTRR